jgi:hypothetical protein
VSPLLLWKTFHSPKAFPPFLHIPCGFPPYFSTGCGKPCGKKKFCTGRNGKVCVNLQNPPVFAKNPPFSTHTPLLDVWTNSPQLCGKAEGRDFIHRPLWISENIRAGYSTEKAADPIHNDGFGIAETSKNSGKRSPSPLF